MKKRGMPSPDEGDAVALCFSEPGGSRVCVCVCYNKQFQPGHSVCREWLCLRKAEWTAGARRGLYEPAAR
jgi:hypothetical protein